MWNKIGVLIVILFGVFFIGVSLLMLFRPEMARATLRKAGSTNFINYGEITLRMIPASGLLLAAEYSKFPQLFSIVGMFMIATSLILYFVPRKWHHTFSNTCADFLTPTRFQWISPLSFLIGISIIYAVY